MKDLAYKWVPVVGDACTGCGLCVHACDNHCLELVWDFATLQRPRHCASDGKCAAACPRTVIEMQWVQTDGAPDVGRWRDESETPAVSDQPKSWLSSLFK